MMSEGERDAGMRAATCSVCELRDIAQEVLDALRAVISY
jgi:hypothetical protein